MRAPLLMRPGQLLGLCCIAATTTCAEARRVDPREPLSAFASASAPTYAVGDARAATIPGDFEANGDRAVVVVVLDGARWQEVYLGVDPTLADADEATGGPMPRLNALARDRGVALGAPGFGPIVRASGPNFVSLPGYTELFTGRAPLGCGDNECARTRVPTVADELRAHAASPREVAIFASWPDIERAASAHPEELVVSTGRHVRYQEPMLREDAGASRILDEAADADPFPGRGDFRPDRYTAALALRYLERVHPRFLFLGLGEPDEHAHHGDYAGYLRAMREADEVVADLVRTLDRMGERGRRTSVLVTADHGRARDFRDHGGAYPESARVWLVGLGGDIAARGPVTAGEEHRLADIAPTIRASLGLPVDPAREAGRPIVELLPARAVAR